MACNQKQVILRLQINAERHNVRLARHNSQFPRPMTNLPEDEGLHVVRRNEPEPHLLYTAMSRVERQAPEPDRPERFTFFTLGRISVIVGIVLFIGSLFASRYLIQQLHREAGVPEAAAPVAISIAPTAALSAPKAVRPVARGVFHVPSIWLGDVLLTVVDGKQWAEADRLPVTTPDGIIQ